MKLKRLGAIGSTLVLLGLAVAVPSVSAAQNAPEIVVSNAVDQAGPYVVGSSYNAARVTLAIRNTNSSTFTQVRLTVEPCLEGRTAPTDPCVRDESVVARAALDATQAEPTSSPHCTLQASVYTCTLPNVSGNSTGVPIEFVYSSSSGLGFDLDAKVSVKDQSNTGTSNQDRIDTAARLIHVDVSARADRQTPFFPPNQPFTVSTFKQGNIGQRATLKLPSSSKGYLVDLQEFLADEEPSLPDECRGALAPAKTLGQLISASVNSGVRISPYLEWTIETTFGKGVTPDPATGVVHCTLKNGNWAPLEIKTDATGQCGNAANDPSNGCLVWSKGSAYQIKTSGNTKTGNFNTTYTFTLRTLSNGFVKISK
jgi:hypothetical protein